MSEIPGITLYGATTMVNSENDVNPDVMGDWMADADSIAREPVYLFAGMVDDLIATGQLQAGSLNNVEVRPPVEQWPTRWRFLKQEQ
jgi:hypothetical protein